MRSTALSQSPPEPKPAAAPQHPNRPSLDTLGRVLINPLSVSAVCPTLWRPRLRGQSDQALVTRPLVFESQHKSFGRRNLFCFFVCSQIVKENYAQLFVCNFRRTIGCCPLKESKSCVVPCMNIRIAKLGVLFSVFLPLHTGTLPEQARARTSPVTPLACAGGAGASKGTEVGFSTLPRMPFSRRRQN